MNVKENEESRLREDDFKNMGNRGKMGILAVFLN